MSTISLLNQLPTNNLLFPVLNSFILYNPANACLSRFLRLCCSSLASWKRSCVTTVILVFGNKIPEVLMHQCWQSATKLLHITSLCAILVRPWYAQFIRPKQTGFCFGLSSLLSSTFFFLVAHTQTAVTKLSAVHKGAKPFQMLHTSFWAVFSFTSFLVSFQISLWCHWVDLDIRYTVSMWDNFPTNWPQSQSWLVCWISRDQNEMHSKSVLFFYTLDCNSKVLLEPNFLKVDRTPDLAVIWAPDWIQLQ